MYQQHLQKLSKMQRFDCPRDAIIHDLTQEMRGWQEDGDHLIVLTDFNDDVTDTPVRAWAAQLGLVEAITWLTVGDAPPTYQRGSRPIDGIFMAPQLLQLATGGYLSFGDAVPSDHRAIWIDLHLPEINPPNPESYLKPSACRLQCKDPCIVDCYNQVLLEILHNHNIPQRLSQLQELLRKPTDLRRVHRLELNQIDNIVTAAKHAAEKQCRKLKCGQAEWCPLVTKAINKIMFWKSILKHETGSKGGISILRTHAKKANIEVIPRPGELAVNTINEIISKAYKHFRHLKKDDTRCDTWIAQLIKAQATVWIRPKKTLWKLLRSTERIRCTACNVRHALQKVVVHCPLSMVVAPGIRTA